MIRSWAQRAMAVKPEPPYEWPADIPAPKPVACLRCGRPWSEKVRERARRLCRKCYYSVTGTAEIAQYPPGGTGRPKTPAQSRQDARTGVLQVTDGFLIGTVTKWHREDRSQVWLETAPGAGLWVAANTLWEVKKP